MKRRRRFFVDKYILTRYKAYAKNIIPPAADAENLAMADMSIEKVAVLVKLTATFTENMERRFADIKED